VEAEQRPEWKDTAVRSPISIVAVLSGNLYVISDGVLGDAGSRPSAVQDSPNSSPERGEGGTATTPRRLLGKSSGYQ
jgi:hypothetical protein